MAEEKRTWLLHAFDSEYFVFWMAIKCLTRYTDLNIHQFICFRAYQTRYKDIAFHFPQLIHLMLAEEGPVWTRPLFRMLYRTAQAERHLPLALSMYAVATAASLPDTDSSYTAAIEAAGLFSQIGLPHTPRPKTVRRPPTLYLAYLRITAGSKVGLSPSTRDLLTQQKAFYNLSEVMVRPRPKQHCALLAGLATLLSGLVFTDKDQHAFLTDAACSLAPRKSRPLYLNKGALDRVLVKSAVSSREAQLITRLRMVSDTLLSVPRASREAALSTELNLLNLFLPAPICFPLGCTRHTNLLRLSVAASHALDSAARAPFMLVYEASPSLPPSDRLEEEPEKTQATKQAVLRTAIKILGGLKELGTHAGVDLDVLSIKTRVIKKIYGVSATPGQVKGRTGHIDEWPQTIRSIQRESQFASLPGWSVRSVIVKTGSDMRQEVLATQVLRTVANIWAAEGVPLLLRPYEVIVTGVESGLIETVVGARSVHQIKKLLQAEGKGALLTYFEQEWPNTLEEAKEGFFLSLVGYALVSYILQVKDRHNGNILIDASGRMLHIDFGFVLGTYPGFYSVESAPFKFSVEYAEVIGPARMARFREEFLRGYLALRKHMDQIVSLVESVEKGGSIPSITAAATEGLRARFVPGLTEAEFLAHAEETVSRGMKSVFTEIYDSFQYYTQGYCR
ncbi:phosphatidylinositol 4-kinase B [Nematocida homosporus]|uniref:phosphatidylinositol 4-kinase B n=1 Tax=Nematocida homosporus TaxID=1912981 RepID=UPI00221F6393|nr:phosphatidylinositol 4-kinase B [Nematocida homosporus]KAI5187194.1 phosphatidylinositol 4-kinase B [Nematocida homosporus]